MRSLMEHPVKFGRHQGALTKLSKMVGWDLPTLHCFNHKLELAIKDKTFTEIKEMLDVLYSCLKIVEDHGVYTNMLLKPETMFRCVLLVLEERDFNLTL